MKLLDKLQRLGDKNFDYQMGGVGSHDLYLGKRLAFTQAKDLVEITIKELLEILEARRKEEEYNEKDFSKRNYYIFSQRCGGRVDAFGEVIKLIEANFGGKDAK